MAKNILQAKKRVSHFQKTHKDFESENELFGCNDYVSSIIHDMDSNFTSAQSGYSKRDIEFNETKLVTLEDVPLLQMSESSSKRILQIPPKHLKIKKFSLSRKFPLMEKSQKILKQLKHNQNIPKPRAHLAGILKSPAKNKMKSTSKISAAKQKLLYIRNKTIHNPHCKISTNTCVVLNNKSSNLSKVLKNDLATEYMSKNNITGKSSVYTSRIVDTNTETTSKLEYDSSTSDGEYERFIKKSKEDLPKKSSKKQKQISRKSKSSSKGSKRKKLKHVSEEGNNDCDNIESFWNGKGSSLKPPKIVPAITDFEDDSNCSDIDIPDWSTRVLSSESDDDSVATSMTQQIVSETCELKSIDKTVFLSGANPLSVPESSNSDSVSSFNKAEVGNSVLGVKGMDITKAFSGEDSHVSCRNSHAFESYTNSAEVQSEFLNETSINPINVEQNNLPSNLVIDVCDSDDECENTELNTFSQLNSCVISTSIENKTTSLADLDTDESDIEIVEVIKHVQTVSNCSASMLVNIPDRLNIVGSEKQLVMGNECVDVKPFIKTEILSNKSILPPGKVQNKAKTCDNHNIAYSTDICHTKLLEQKTTVENHCSKTQNVSLKESSQATPDLTVVKHELSSDDDIIILDYVTKPADVLNRPFVKAENIKSEPSTSENKLKSFDPINSEPEINDTIERDTKFQDVIPVSSAELLEWYKMEFQTLKEMNKANADVETSLRNLHARQAQKLLYVRNLLYKCVKSNKTPKPLMLQKGDNPEDAQNCDTTPNNSFSINPPEAASTSTVVLDIKPGVKLEGEMQPIGIKPEIQSDQENYSKKLIPKNESDDKQTLKLLNEKCSVCSKDAVAACQKCAKVFFCSHECGRKFWIEGHVNVCGTK